MILNPPQKEDVLFYFFEGIDIEDLPPEEAFFRVLDLLQLDQGAVRSFLEEDQRLVPGSWTLCSFEEDREPPGEFYPDWEWYISLLIQKKRIQGQDLVEKVSRIFQISQKNAALELEDLKFLDD